MIDYRFLLALTVSLLAISQAASAAVIDHYGIETVLGRNLEAMTTVTLEMTSPLSHLSYDLDFPIYNLTVEMDQGTHSCSFENDAKGSEILCDFYGIDEGPAEVKMRFYSNQVVRRDGDKYVFRETYPVSADSNDFFMLLQLPERSTLSEEAINESYFPPNGNLFTDGKSIFIVWERQNVTAGDSISFSVSFIPSGDRGSMWSVTVVGITTLVVMVMVGIAVYMRRGSRPAENEVKVLPLLNKDEKRVMDIVAKNGGEVRQREIVKESDFSKAKVSRLIRNLKERGVVDTEPISGRENKVILRIKGVETG